MADTGNTAAISFTGISGTVQSISIGDQTREALESTPLNVTVASGKHSAYKEFVPDRIIDPGEIDVTMYLDSNSEPADILAGAGTLTITFPLQSGQTTARTLAGTAFATRMKYGDLEQGALTMAEVTFKFDGLTDPTFTAGS